MQENNPKEDKSALPTPSYITSMSKTYGCGDILFREGEVGRDMFILLKGRVRIEVSSSNGTVTLGEFREGEFFGEMALVGDGVRTGTAEVCEEGTELVAVNQARFVYLVSQQPVFALSIMRSMARRMEAMNVRMAEMALQPA